MRTAILLISIITSFNAAGSLAGVIQTKQSQLDLSTFMEDHLARIDSQSCLADASPNSLDDGSSDWEVRHFFLNISPYVSVGIRGVAQVTITPEIEFIWERIDAN